MKHHRLFIAALVLTAVCLIGLFSTEIADTDFWWHLKTGQYIVERHKLPVPDPFAHTGSDSPVGHFNLTHEWLSQTLMYLVYWAGGFPAIILVRATLLTALCGLAGLLAARLSGSAWAGIAAAFATASVATEFAADRPGLVTFLGVAAFVTVLELRRGLWTLPLIALVWANCHGGFVAGWIVLLAYSIEMRSRRVWLLAASAVAASLINPNGYGVIATLLRYRQSEMTKNLIEWHAPSLWGPPYGFDLLLYAGAGVLFLARKRVRVAHWILFGAFAAASLMAFRNILLIGFLAPIWIAAYWPYRKHGGNALSVLGPALPALVLIIGLVRGSFFQYRVADWTTPASASEFLLANHFTGPMFNTYEQGGYLIWKLWPQERVFIDGRALSESGYRDYRQILFNTDSAADQVAGARADLLNHYGIQLVAMNTLDYVSGAMYPLALALANPVSSDWQLVYDDPQEVIFARQPGAGIPVLDNKLARVLKHMDAECAAYIEHSPDTPLCARTLADYWLRNGVRDRARRMLQLYLSHVAKPDVQAEQALDRMR